MQTALQKEANLMANMADVADAKQDYMKPFEAGVVSDFIVQKMLKHTFNALYSKCLDKLLIKHVVRSSLNMLTALAALQDRDKDSGEVIMESEAAQHAWGCSHEPVLLAYTF